MEKFDFSNFENKEEALKALVSLRVKDHREYMDYLIQMGQLGETKNIKLPENWFEEKSKELGMTPREYVLKLFDGEMSFEDALKVFVVFSNDDQGFVPDGVCELLASFGEGARDHIVEVLSDTESLKVSYNDSSDRESLAKQDVIISVLQSLPHFACEKTRVAAWKAFDECLDDNEAIIEFAAEGICQAFGTGELVAKLGGAEKIGFKELTLMQVIVIFEEKSDENYRCLRKCVKMCGKEEKITALSIFADYGDPRAVTLLRAVAKEMKESLAPGGMNANEGAFQELYMVASMINKLGGNTEDIIGM